VAISSSAPPEGGRRARLAAEREGRETPAQGTKTEVLQSRAAARRARKVSDDATGQLRLDDSPATGSVLLTPHTPTSIEAPSDFSPVGGPKPAPVAIGPSTTELALRRRREVRPPTARRRLERTLGRSVSSRRIWGGALAVGLVLVVPGATMLQSSVTVAEGAFKGSATLALDKPADEDQAVRPGPDPADGTTTALAKAKSAAISLAAAAEKAAAEAAKDAKNDTKKTTKAPTSGSTGRLNTQLSGLSWVSGVYSRGQGQAGVQAFGAWRGAPVDVVVDWGARQSWDDIVNPKFLFTTWKGTPYTKVIGIAPVPEGDSSATMAGCAAGNYNDKWRQFGSNFKNAGMDSDTVIRLGWEFNGDWFKWSANDPGQFAECWRQIVSSAESTAPALLWDWNVNRGKGASVADARQAYPGDAYVDIVGVDSYDMWPGATNAASWAEQYSGPYGLKFWSDFARQHGKKMSVPEWAVYPGPSSQGSNGGDNAFYVGKMHEFFKSEGSHLAYESYFNESADYVAGAIFTPTQNPTAAAKYESLFRR
jgi:hypothetical protein